ncbi:hypothetical protein WI560_12160 [Bradyrhizobium sp. A11]|jgi:hypothetical protein|uniref:hypothetical protein n=1 Tax=Bradyrhizobium sp. A11 TaxID=3133974 RepID=UPI0032535A57
MMTKRNRKRPTNSLHDRIEEFARLAKEDAENLPAGRERDAALRRARQARTGAQIDEWVNSTGLKPPK